MSDTARVYIVDDDRAIRWVLEHSLAQPDLAVSSFEDADAALAAIREQVPEVLITDIRMPGTNGLDLTKAARELYPHLPVIVTTAHSDLDSAVASYQSGAFEYLPKPFDVDDALTLVRRAVAHAREQASAPFETRSDDTALPEIIGEAPAMQEVFRAIGRLAHSNITVMINGASGTGKERVARALHQHSPRARKPFVALNMAAIPKALMESELFGHEKGAFTGANALRRGRFEQADGGTLFLDEIGDMPADTQTRLLRVLSDGEFYRVGGHVGVKVNVRIIAATHQDLERRVAEGQFREDLFHRLNVIRIRLPLLAERREDIPQLARHFLAQAARDLAAEPKTLTPEVEEHLSQLPWPGNVRQLENACRWLTVMASGREVLVDDLPPELRTLPGEHPSSAATSPTAPVHARWEDAFRRWVDEMLIQGHTQVLETAALDVERILIERALQHTHGRRGAAALLLGWGRNTLTRKIKVLLPEIAEEREARNEK